MLNILDAQKGILTLKEPVLPENKNGRQGILHISSFESLLLTTKLPHFIIF